MPAAEDLARDPLAFMQRNIVRIAVPQVASSDGAMDFSLVDAEGFSGFRTMTILRWARCVNVFYLIPYNNVAGTRVSAYWLGYKSDSAQFQMLTDQASLMFTANMTGCTFGVGSEGGNGSRLVTHVNLQEEGVADELAMRQIGNQVLGPGAVLLEKSQYKLDEADNATTFGFRKNGRWSFYRQRYRMDMETLRLLDVLSISA